MNKWQNQKIILDHTPPASNITLQRKWIFSGNMVRIPFNLPNTSFQPTESIYIQVLPIINNDERQKHDFSKELKESFTEFFNFNYVK